MAGARAWGLFAAVSVLWGVPYLFIGVALRSGFGPVSLAAARVVLAALVLAPFGLRRARRALLRGRGGRLAVLAVVEVVVPVAAACYAVGAVLISHWFGDVPALGIAAAVLAIAAPVLVVATVVAVTLGTEPPPAPTPAGIASVAALGIGATAAGFVAFFALVAASGPDHAALITYAAPVVAVACGALLLHEPLGARTLLGTALVFAGAWLATRPDRVPPASPG
ncbi:MAG: hypothetical protein ABT15_24170 [Pseudonocardia sp. SCN 73-27]|uniref:DMT family transporter n=1 Tax=unclassified Pseudonocardia TaxID=2619320 RepID=UPI000868C928|nr:MULTISPECIES: DMT family transporter [unclassified Pseudonocardia]ODU25600.1 MAG: hypothetical protein ABS80_09690 [Pseudonocardia sp. SCN 72-51]ODV02929.1 MAG: hypothetical protein ABT15_24170 [Pseudonocardia sp. SCN 73-27]